MPVISYDGAVRERVQELHSVFAPPYDDLIGLAYEDHNPGECVQCDAYRALYNECPNCGGTGSMRVHGPEDYGSSFESDECEACAGSGQL